VFGGEREIERERVGEREEKQVKQMTKKAEAN